MKQLIRKTLLALIGGVMCNAAWADEITVPTPVYFNDFATAVSGQDGIEIKGNGVFENDADARFGRIFHNDPGTTPAKQFRTNYLKLPTTLLSASGADVSKKLTIGFWVNKKNAVNFYNSPIFTAYNAAPTGDGNKSNTWPMMAMETRGVLFSNNYGIFNSENSDNVNKTNTPSTAWLDDGNWHFYTCVITETTCIIYYDGNILNSFSVDNSDGHNLAHIFGNLNNLTYVCLGGNQAWDWSGDLDIDPAFAFDDFAVYDVALSVDQIKQIMKNKLVQGTQIGEIDCSTTYLAESSNKIVLRPGESAKFRFNNYIRVGALNNEAWHLIVADPDNTNKIVIRADWWDDLNGSTVEEHQRGFSTNAGNYWDNVPSKMNWATVEMTVTFTSDKKFTMASTTTSQDGSTTWTYNYTSDNANNINLDLSSLKVALSVNLSWIDLLSNSITTTIGDIGWSTFVSANNLDFSKAQDGLSAYAITGRSGSAITKEAVTGIVPAGTPLLVSGTANTSYTVPVATSAGSAPVGNLLKPGNGSAVGYVEGKTRYVLSADGTTPVFKKLVDGGSSATVPAGKAYLEFNEVISARELTFDFNSETTAISELTNTNLTNNTNEYFNLAGQRVAQPTKGLYIVNGKKVLLP